MQSVKQLTLCPIKGIVEAPDRTFDWRPAKLKVDEDPKWRHLSFICREELRQHELALGTHLGPGAAKANVELQCLQREQHGLGSLSKTMEPHDFLNLRGHELIVKSGSSDNDKHDGAKLVLTVQRDPCRLMDAVCKGLMEEMKGGNQGFFCQVITGGVIKVGDIVYLHANKDKTPSLTSSSSLSLPLPATSSSKKT